jgi:uncharacterized coiled-coil protein SlyX
MNPESDRSSPTPPDPFEHAITELTQVIRRQAETIKRLEERLNFIEKAAEKGLADEPSLGGDVRDAGSWERGLVRRLAWGKDAAMRCQLYEQTVREQSATIEQLTAKLDNL